MFDGVNDINSASFEKDLTFFYKGFFKENLTLEILDLSEFNHQFIEKKFLNRKLVLLTEAIQNVEKYRLKDSFEDTLFISSSNGCLNIITSNVFLTNESNSLKNIIEKINGKTEEELDAYLNYLLGKDLKSQKSAGIGFVQMVRKLKKPIEYTISKVDEKHSIFKLHLSIILKEKYISSVENEDVLNKYEQFNQFFRHKTGIYYQGKIANKATIPILKILENYLTSSITNFKLDSKKYFVIIEMIQNMGKHGVYNQEENKGIFCIAKDIEGKLRLFTCNRINSPKIEVLDSHLKKLLVLSKEKIALYNESKIKSKFENADKGANIGISSLILYSSPDKVKYKFISDSNKKFFYLESEI